MRWTPEPETLSSNPNGHLSCWETLGQSLNFLGPQFFPSAKWVVANRAVERTEGVNSCKVLKIVLGMWENFVFMVMMTMCYFSSWRYNSG